MAMLPHAYAQAERSSWKIERRRRENVALQELCANQATACLGCLAVLSDRGPRPTTLDLPAP